MIKTNVDMVFCIDSTASMADIIETAPRKIMDIYHDVKESREKQGGHVDTFRVRIIAYRNYLVDAADAMLVTKFFTLPQEANDLKRCVSSLTGKGGGDGPKDGLEALAYAIRSRWNNEPYSKNRHIIVLWTDNDTHDLGYGKYSNHYPKGMAADFQELTAWWGNQDESGYMSQSAKRLILLAPDSPGWRKVSDSWDAVVQYPSEAGRGMKDFEYRCLINVMICMDL